MTTTEKRIKLIKLIATLDPKKHYVDESYVQYLEGAPDHVIDNIYYKCYDSKVWEGSYDNEAIFLKRCIDHS